MAMPEVIEKCTRGKLQLVNFKQKSDGKNNKFF
jgi:hypothetical protein